MSDAVFMVGDRVVKRQRLSGAIVEGDRATVESVGLRRITLDDGSVWRRDGYAWGSGGKRNRPGEARPGDGWRIYRLTAAECGAAR